MLEFFKKLFGKGSGSGTPYQNHRPIGGERL